jgi:glutathione S-transferase
MLLEERHLHADAFWQRLQRRLTFLAAYANRSSGAPELDNRR